MKCNDVRKLETEFLDGLLPTGEADAVRIHLRACPPCRERLKELGAVKEGLANLKAPEIPEQRLGEIESRLMAQPVRVKPAGVNIRRRLQHAADGLARFSDSLSTATVLAALIIVLIVTSSVIFHPVLPKSEDLPLAAAWTRTAGHQAESAEPSPRASGAIQPVSFSDLTPEEILAAHIILFTESKYEEVGRDTFAVLACKDVHGESCVQRVVDGVLTPFSTSGAFPVYRAGRCPPTHPAPGENGEDVILHIFQRILVSG